MRPFGAAVTKRREASIPTVKGMRRLAGRPRACLILLHCVMIRLAFYCRALHLTHMLRPPAYLSQKLTRRLRTKDGGTLRTVLDARTYMLPLSEDREHRAQWQRAAELLLAEADVDAFSKQVGLALFFDAKLDLRATK
jgi:hypothetical protein